MTAPQLLSAVVGCTISVAALTVFMLYKARRFKALFWMAIGATMIYAAFRPQIIELLGPDSIELRLRLIVALISFLVLTVTLETIRTARMQERYAVLWLATGSLLLLGALFEEVAMIIPRMTGLSFGATVMLVLFTFTGLLLFSISASLSHLRNQLSQTARALALTEERLRKIENRQTINCDQKPKEIDSEC